jgi:hypothetical protein
MHGERRARADLQRMEIWGRGLQSVEWYRVSILPRAPRFHALPTAPRERHRLTSTAHTAAPTLPPPDPFKCPSASVLTRNAVNECAELSSCLVLTYAYGRSTQAPLPLPKFSARVTVLGCGVLGSSVLGRGVLGSSVLGTGVQRFRVHWFW